MRFIFALQQLGPVKIIIYLILMSLIIGLIFKFVKSIILAIVFFILINIAAGIMFNEKKVDSIVNTAQNEFKKIQRQINTDQNKLYKIEKGKANPEDAQKTNDSLTNLSEQLNQMKKQFKRFGIEIPNVK